MSFKSFKKNKLKKIIILSFLFISLSLICLTSLSGCIDSPTEESTEVKEGSAAPDFTFSLLDKSDAKLSDYEGRIVLLNFWGLGCPPCIMELPAFETLQREFPDDLTVLAINCQDPVVALEYFKEKSNPTFTIGYVDSKNCPYPIQSIPYTVIIDKEGNISLIQIGAGSAEVMYNNIYKPAIVSLLEKEKK
ncbi:MAG: TlpA family protein disulfide reductase [Methanosarcinaceae archaeon]|nr:TlpA family protein disulfide reductase [Methanosarcinaceae archaeon]